MAYPKISVIMSVYNGEHYLKEAIDSILNQTLKDFEFIIVDDCSTDSSLEIIQSYSDNRIILIKNPTNIGLTKSLNIALSLAQGDYVARIDHDDICLSNRLQIQSDFLDSNPDIIMVCSLTQSIDEVGAISHVKSRINSSEEIYYYLHFINPITHPSTMFRKKAIIDNAGFNEEFILAQDFELWTRLFNKYKFAKIPEILISYRTTTEQLSKSSLGKQKKYAEKVFLRTMKELGLEDNEIKESLYFHSFAFQNNSKDISIRKLKLLANINQKIINNCPFFLNVNAIKKAASKMFYYYLTCYLRKFRILNPLFDFLSNRI